MKLTSLRKNKTFKCLQDYRQGTKPIVTRASESLASINSIPNTQGNLGSNAFPSMTSLKSADDVLLQTNKNAASETESDGKKPGENSDTGDKTDNVETSTQNGGSEKLIEFSPTKPKLVDISPTVQTVDGVTESESNTDNTGESTPSKVEEINDNSVDGNLVVKERTSPIVTHQPDSPTRRSALFVLSFFYLQTKALPI